MRHAARYRPARGQMTTDLECVMSSWWLASEAGAGEAAVEDVGAVLELAEAAPDGGDQVVGVGEGAVGGGDASQDGPDAFDRVEVGCVGRQLEDGEPVAGGDVAAHSGRQARVEIVPDQHDRAAELLVGGLDQVAVVLPGEAFAPVGPGVWAGPVDQPGGFAGLVAGQGGHR